jgi:DNA-binding transcriptional MerR regulator
MLQERKIVDEKELDFLSKALFQEEFPNLIDTIDNPRFSVDDLNITPRDATYWDKQGILPAIKGPGTRRKYDLVQSVWLKFVQQMRSLGISLNKIRELKENLLEPKIDLSQLNPETLSKIVENLRTKYDSSLSVENFLSEINEYGPSVFKTTILATIIFRKKYLCLVNHFGDFLIYDSTKHSQLLSESEEFEEFTTTPHISLSFADAYSMLVQNWAPKPYLCEISLLSETEIEILNMIRKTNINSITIKYKKGEPDLLEVEEKNAISIEQRFLDVITKNGFQKISVATRNGDIVNFVNKIQKKLNKSTK